MTEMLILTMLEALNEWGDNLNFTKSDIDKFAENLQLKEDINERGYIMLWKNKYITDKQLENILDFKFDGKDICLIVDDFDDILNEEDYQTEIDLLRGEDIFDWNFYETDIDPYWSDYDETTLKEIIEYCVKEGLEIDDQLMTDENTVLKDGDIYFNDEKLINYLNRKSYYKHDLKPLKRILNSAICQAQHEADINEAYEDVKRYFEDKIGTFEWINVQEREKKSNKLKIKLNISLSEIEDILIDFYGKYEFEYGTYGNIYIILKQYEYFDIKTPNYNYISGNIDNNELNELTRDRLAWK